jgi:hypothetical protein
MRSVSDAHFNTLFPRQKKEEKKKLFPKHTILLVEIQMNFTKSCGLNSSTSSREVAIGTEQQQKGCERESRITVEIERKTRNGTRKSLQRKLRQLQS